MWNELLTALPGLTITGRPASLDALEDASRRLAPLDHHPRTECFRCARLVDRLRSVVAGRVPGQHPGRLPQRPTSHTDLLPIRVGHVVRPDHHGQRVGTSLGVAVWPQDADSKPTKLAEHGGMNAGDRHVLMVVDSPGVPAQIESAPVETTQVAPTILSVLGLNPARLTAVKVEGTQVLPGLADCRRGN